MITESKITVLLHTLAALEGTITFFFFSSFKRKQKDKGERKKKGSREVYLCTTIYYTVSWDHCTHDPAIPLHLIDHFRQ